RTDARAFRTDRERRHAIEFCVGADRSLFHRRPRKRHRDRSHRYKHVLYRGGGRRTLENDGPRRELALHDRYVRLAFDRLYHDRSRPATDDLYRSRRVQRQLRLLSRRRTLEIDRRRRHLELYWLCRGAIYREGRDRSTKR